MVTNGCLQDSLSNNKHVDRVFTLFQAMCFILTTALKLGTIIIPILLMEKWKYKQVKKFANISQLVSDSTGIQIQAGWPRMHTFNHML